jgi:hypothetical protein
LLSVTANFAGGILLSGSASTGFSSIVLTVDKDITIGAHDIGDLFTDNYAWYNKSTTEIFLSTSGKLTVTKHDKTTKLIEAKFEFVGTVFSTSNTINITEGSFSLRY